MLHFLKLKAPKVSKLRGCKYCSTLTMHLTIKLIIPFVVTLQIVQPSDN